MHCLVAVPGFNGISIDVKKCDVGFRFCPFTLPHLLPVSGACHDLSHGAS